VHPPTFQEFRRRLQRANTCDAIFCFVGHGRREDGPELSLPFESEKGETEFINIEEFKGELKNRVQLVLLGACHSHRVARKLVEMKETPYAIGIFSTMQDRGAREFMKEILHGLWNERSLAEVIKDARKRVHAQDNEACEENEENEECKRNARAMVFYSSG